MARRLRTGGLRHSGGDPEVLRAGRQPPVQRVDAVQRDVYPALRNGPERSVDHQFDVQRVLQERLHETRHDGPVAQQRAPRPQRRSERHRDAIPAVVRGRTRRQVLDEREGPRGEESGEVQIGRLRPENEAGLGRAGLLLPRLSDLLQAHDHRGGGAQGRGRLLGVAVSQIEDLQAVRRLRGNLGARDTGQDAYGREHAGQDGGDGHRVADQRARGSLRRPRRGFPVVLRRRRGE